MNPVSANGGGTGGASRRVPEERLRRDLALLYRVGYRSCLLLIAIGVVAAAFGSNTLGGAAVAGIIVLLATPVAGAFWVGVRALSWRDIRLTLVASGILLMLVVSALLQFQV